MPWFKVDDTFPLHAKVMAAGNGAIGLWVRAGAWSMQQLTDGHVPTTVARTLGTAAEARKLVEVGLWTVVAGGYSFHQWGERQPTREQVEADRHAARERQRKGREAAKSRRDTHRDNTRSSAVSHGPPDPTRPDPTSSSFGTTSSANAERRPKRAAHTIPDDFEPNDTNRRIAAERSVDLDAAVDNFRDHHAAKGDKFKDWNLALNTWLRNERPTRREEQPRSLPHAHELEHPPDGLSEAEYSSWLRSRRQGVAR